MERWAQDSQEPEELLSVVKVAGRRFVRTKSNAHEMFVWTELGGVLGPDLYSWIGLCDMGEVELERVGWVAAEKQ